MASLSIWLTIFTVGHAMDICTTLLCEKLPKEYRGEELNPSVAKGIREKFKRTLAHKIFVVIAFVGCCLALNTMPLPTVPLLIVVQVMTIMILLVVANNSYIYVAKRIKKRRVWTPGGFLTERLHIPSNIAYYILVAILLGVSYSLTRIIW